MGSPRPYVAVLLATHFALGAALAAWFWLRDDASLNPSIGMLLAAEAALLLGIYKGSLGSRVVLTTYDALLLGLAAGAGPLNGATAAVYVGVLVLRLAALLVVPSRHSVRTCAA